MIMGEGGWGNLSLDWFNLLSNALKQNFTDKMKGNKHSTIWKCPPFNVLVFCWMCYKELFVNVCNKGSLQKRSPARKIEDLVYFKAIFKNKKIEKKICGLKRGIMQWLLPPTISSFN